MTIYKTKGLNCKGLSLFLCLYITEHNFIQYCLACIPTFILYVLLKPQGYKGMKRTSIKRRPLSDTVLANLVPESKDYRELDGNGLYFFVQKNGNKSWQLRYKKPDGK